LAAVRLYFCTKAAEKTATAFSVPPGHIYNLQVVYCMNIEMYTLHCGWK
jgi:hypothetical protein